MKTFIAFSGGVESSALCVLYGKDSIPVFTDTGYEHDRMYERIDLVEKALKIIHGDHFRIIRIQAKNAEGTGASTLPEYIRIRKFYPNSNARFCTRLFKIEPMDDFLRDQGECRLMIGLNYDEAEDRVGNLGECKNVEYIYPHVDDRRTRIQCEQLLTQYGLLPNFPPYMTRGGCKGCFFKGKKEYAEMAVHSPLEALEVADLEDSIQDKRGSHYHIHPGIPNMRKFITGVQSQQVMFPDEYYPSYSTGASCGILCHR